MEQISERCKAPESFLARLGALLVRLSRGSAAADLAPVTLRAPVSWLEKVGLLDVAMEQYGEHFEMGVLVDNKDE